MTDREREQVRTDEVERVQFAIAFEGPEAFVAERVGLTVERIRRELTR